MLRAPRSPLLHPLPLPSCVSARQEVRLKGGAPELLHSKSSRGQGRCESQEEVDAVLEQIGAHLRGKKGN